LHFILLSNDDLRAESLQGLVDAVGAGRMDGTSVGKKNILPSSYTGGRRYMIENFQDAVAISRVHGCPDIFSTFTCNPKWPEISEALSVEPGQRAHNRADITVRVYHMKLAEYLHDIRTGVAFGKVAAGNLASITLVFPLFVSFHCLYFSVLTACFVSSLAYCRVPEKGVAACPYTRLAGQGRTE
jgi:hypothetical protein